MKRIIFSPGIHSHWTSLGLFILRAGIGGAMLAGHGWAKLSHFTETTKTFPDPLGIENPALSVGMAIIAEVLCSALIVLGVATRITVLPLIFTMVIAIFVVHGDQEWAQQELAVLYVIPLTTLFFTGAGSYSIDALICSPLDIPAGDISKDESNL